MSELIGRLDPDRRAAFVLTQVLGLSYDEASASLRVPTGDYPLASQEPALTWSAS